MKTKQLIAKQEKFGLKELDLVSVIRRGLSRGGEFAELFFEETESTRLLFEDGKVDKILEGTDRGAGMRVVFQNRVVMGYTTDLTQTALMQLAEALSAAIPAGTPVLRNMDQGKYWTDLTWSAGVQSDGEIRDYRVQNNARLVAMEEKLDWVKRADQAARRCFNEGATGADHLKQVSCVALDSQRRTFVVNSDGLVQDIHKNYLQFVVQLVGACGDRVESAYNTDGGFVGTEFLEQVTPESLAQKAATTVLTLLRALPAPAGTMPVVLSAEAGGTMIHEAVGHGLEADLACNGLSVYQDKVGQQVASHLITVIDDGTMLARRGSYAFDDEGNPSHKTVLIDKGILKGYLVDRISALKFDLSPTGNGRRESFRHRPIVRMTNTYIAPGEHDPAEILRDTKWGVFVKQMGGGQVNTVTGDFVFAVTEGYLIRNGKLAEPIRGATLVGNGPKVLMDVDRVGNDLGFATGTCGKDGQGAPVTDAQPTLRIPALTVGGEVPLQKYWPEVC